VKSRWWSWPADGLKRKRNNESRTTGAAQTLPSEEELEPDGGFELQDF
jgi:hypothetical protein